jgi:DNA-binding MarR family transcriptional regulator
MSPANKNRAPIVDDDRTGDTPALIAAGLVLSRLGRQSERALGPLQLTLTQYRVLAFLAGGSSFSSLLANELQVTPPSITGVVTGLVARGLVTRRTDPNDLRRQPVKLTKAGIRALAAAEQVVTGILADVLSYLEPSEVESVMDAFRLCEVALDRRFEAIRD